MCDSDSSDSSGSSDSGGSSDYSPSPSSYTPSVDTSPSFSPSAPTVDYSPTPDPTPAPAPANDWSHPDPTPDPTPEPETTREYSPPSGTYTEGETFKEQFLADLATGVVEELLDFETFDEYFERTGRTYRGRRPSGSGRKKAVSRPATRASAPSTSTRASAPSTSTRASTASSYDPEDDADAISGPSTAKMVGFAVAAAGGLGLIAYLL